MTIPYTHRMQKTNSEQINEIEMKKIKEESIWIIRENYALYL